MNTSHHAAVKAASAVCGIAAVLAVGEAANLASRRFGPMAGGVLIVSVFAACWLAHWVRPMLHPVPLARRNGTREPEVTAETITLAGSAASR